MLKLDDKTTDFLISILKCFFILLMLGVYFPKIINYILIKYIINSNLQENSTFVFNVVNINRKIVSIFSYIFKSFISY